MTQVTASEVSTLPNSLRLREVFESMILTSSIAKIQVYLLKRNDLREGSNFFSTIYELHRTTSTLEGSSKSGRTAMVYAKIENSFKSKFPSIDHIIEAEQLPKNYRTKAFLAESLGGSINAYDFRLKLHELKLT